jgi:prevent-host-death family protein
MTRTVNVYEAKTRLSELLKAVEAGEDVVIARAGRPVARMVACSGRVGQRPGRGAWKDKIWISEDFENSDEEFVREFDDASRRGLD